MGQIRYDSEFKELVVQRILNGETTAAKTAKELELHYTTIRDWVQHYKKDGQNAFPGSGNLKPEDEEIRKFRKELADLKEENAILKKAAAYFAKNHFICSMSRKGNCYDNAPMESFWGKLKRQNGSTVRPSRPENRLNKLYLNTLSFTTTETDYILETAIYRH